MAGFGGDRWLAGWNDAADRMVDGAGDGALGCMDSAPAAQGAGVGCCALAAERGVCRGVHGVVQAPAFQCPGDSDGGTAGFSWRTRADGNDARRAALPVSSADADARVWPGQMEAHTNARSGGCAGRFARWILDVPLCDLPFDGKGVDAVDRRHP